MIQCSCRAHILFMHAARPGFHKPECSTSSKKSLLEPIPLTDKGLLPADWVVEDPDSHFIYVCRKVNDTNGDDIPAYRLNIDVS